MSQFILIISSVLLVIEFTSTSSVPRTDFIEFKFFQSPATYSVDTTVLVNDIDKKDKEVGYKITSTINVEAVWNNLDTEFLLKFELVSPKLNYRGKHPTANFVVHKSLWDAQPLSTFYMHWRDGLVQAVYLDPAESTEILNYKKSLISLFQFQIFDGERNETDVSGECRVHYETVSERAFRKFKTKCEWEAGRVEEGLGAKVWGARVDWRRVTRYEVGDGEGEGLSRIVADEVGSVNAPGVGVKVRSVHVVTTNTQPSSAPTPSPNAAATLEEALAVLPAALTPHTLPLDYSNKENLNDDDGQHDLDSDQAKWLGSGSAGRGGRGDEALVALRLVRWARTADVAALLNAVRANNDTDALAEWCMVLGAAGSPSALAAADTLLGLQDADPPRANVLAYLSALALSDEPHEEVVRWAMRMGLGTGPVATPALLSAAAAARNVRPHAKGETLRADLKRVLLDSLGRCKEDEECAAVRLQALGNLGSGSDAVLRHAEQARGPAALAAVDALSRSPAPLPANVRTALARLVVQPHRPLEVRAAALDLLIDLSTDVPVILAEVGAALQAGGANELRRVLWQRVLALIERGGQAKELWPLLPNGLRSLPERALRGTSLSLSREAGWAGEGWRAQLDSVQLAAGGLLRRGIVRLRAVSDFNPQLSHTALEMEVWTRGLQELAGDAGTTGSTMHELGPGVEEEEQAAGLAFSVAGVRLPPLTLFTGQGELLSAVWSGAGSSPTPALRALRVLPALSLRVPLLAGAVADLRADAALHIALDAQGVVSLWSRTARAGVSSRGGLGARVSASVRGAGARARAHGWGAADLALHVNADLDFYETTQLCVRVHTDTQIYSRNVSVWSEGGERALRVSRTRAARTVVPGRSLALGRANDAACRALPPPDH